MKFFFLLVQRGDKMSMNDVQKVMDEVDANHDNKLDFDEVRQAEREKHLV